jgi:hypothetical protein
MANRYPLLRDSFELTRAGLAAQGIPLAGAEACVWPQRIGDDGGFAIAALN